MPPAAMEKMSSEGSAPTVIQLRPHSIPQANGSSGSSTRPGQDKAQPSANTRPLSLDSKPPRAPHQPLSASASVSGSSRSTSSNSSISSNSSSSSAIKGQKGRGFGVQRIAAAVLRKVPSLSGVLSAGDRRSSSGSSQGSGAPRREESGGSNPALDIPDMNEELSVSPEVLPWAVNRLYPLIPGKLSFTMHVDEKSTMEEIAKYPELFYFSSDCQEQYNAFCSDFGPVDLGVVQTFIKEMRDKMSDKRLLRRHLVFYSDMDAANRTNSAFLLAAFLMLEYNLTPEEAVSPFLRISPSPFVPFRDASDGPRTYDLDLIDCLAGLYRAVKIGWYDPDNFDIESYQELDDPSSGGDFHVICPKLAAFRGPCNQACKNANPRFAGASRPDAYLETFRELGVSAVVRLNDRETYKEQVFTSRGMHFYDLQFDDCTVPPANIITAFLDACDREPGMLAVHCFAGLGRTGTLIAIWMMKHFGFTAAEAMGWVRIVRPGSVIGPQQQFLKAMEMAKWQGNVPLLDQAVWDSFSVNNSAAMASSFASAVAARAAPRSSN